MRRTAAACIGLLVPAVAILVRTPTNFVPVALAVGIFAIAGAAASAATRRPGLLTLSALALGSEYAISLASRGRQLDPFAPVIALLIFGAVEFAGAEIDGRSARVTRAAEAHRRRALVGVGLAALVACLVVMGGAAVLPSDGTTIRIAGAVSSCAAIAVLAVVVRRSRESDIRDAT